MPSHQVDHIYSTVSVSDMEGIQLKLWLGIAYPNYIFKSWSLTEYTGQLIHEPKG
jgi:hypothetical protein